MKRRYAIWWTVAVLVVLWVHLWARGETTITAPDKADPGSLVTIQAKTDKPFGAWAVIPPSEAVATDSNSSRLYWAAPCGAGQQAFVLAASSQPVSIQVLDILGSRTIVISSSAPVEVASHTVTVGEPAPSPPPPTPPTPTVKTLYGFVVEERHDRTWQVSRILLSAAVRAALQDHLFVIDQDTVDKGDQVPAFWKGWLDATKGKLLPYLFLANENGETVWEGVLPTTEQATLDLIAKYQPKKPAIVKKAAGHWETRQCPTCPKGITEKVWVED
jgi:hypothetical protein